MYPPRINLISKRQTCVPLDGMLLPPRNTYILLRNHLNLISTYQFIENIKHQEMVEFRKGGRAGEAITVMHHLRTSYVLRNASLGNFIRVHLHNPRWYV